MLQASVLKLLPKSTSSSGQTEDRLPASFFISAVMTSVPSRVCLSWMGNMSSLAFKQQQATSVNTP